MTASLGAPTIGSPMRRGRARSVITLSLVVEDLWWMIVLFVVVVVVIMNERQKTLWKLLLCVFEWECSLVLGR